MTYGAYLIHGITMYYFYVNVSYRYIQYIFSSYKMFKLYIIILKHHMGIIKCSNFFFTHVLCFFCWLTLHSGRIGQNISINPFIFQTLYTLNKYISRIAISHALVVFITITNVWISMALGLLVIIVFEAPVAQEKCIL